MTYYEWTTYIEELRNKTITDEIINYLNKSNYDYPQDVLIRLEDHIINVIYNKLIDTRDELNYSLSTVKSPEELVLLINKTKSTLNDTRKLLRVKLMEEDIIIRLKDHINNYSQDYIQTIKNHFKGISSNEYVMVLNNLKFEEVK